MVYLTGAGAGDKSLITVKGLECIKKADVIIFDRLISLSLLNAAPADCRLIYAGKEAGNHHLKQEETNALIVKFAREGKTVVRLKGGDPTVFGRGGEEAQYLAERGIQFELVPGVSSCYSAAEYAGIPVTHRNSASSFHIITGHEVSDRVDYSYLAKIEGTLVFMMGLKSLSDISKKLIENGKDKDTPVAVISNGSRPYQKCVTGTLSNISEKAKRLLSPAVTIIGEVVNEREEWFKTDSELNGVKVFSTALKGFSDNLRAELEKRGGEMIELSLIKTTAINFEKFKKTDLSEFTHMVFSSARGVEVFFDYLAKAKKDIRELCDIRFAVVGEKTSQALKNYGIYADLIPERADGKSLSLLLERELKENDNILLLKSEQSADTIKNTLEKIGVQYTDLSIYQTETNHNRAEAARLCAQEADYVVFASSSAARAYSELVGRGQNEKFISIGSSTTEAAEELGLKICKTAKTPCAADVVRCIIDDLEEAAK